MRTVALTLTCLLLAGLYGIPHPASATDSAGSPASGAIVLQSIELMPDAATIVEGKTLQYKAIGIFSHHKRKDITSMAKWVSSATNVVTISRAGLATAVGGGVPPGGSPAQVTVTASLQGIAGTAALTVTNNLTSISVNPLSPLVYVGLTQGFTAMGSFQDGSMQDITNQASWSSSNTSVLSVISSGSGAGTATGVGLGAANVTASDAGINGGTAATVAPLPIAASFFGMTIGDDVMQLPTVPIGAIGHPSKLAWEEIEPSKGTFCWDYYDRYAEWAEQNDIPLTMAFGTTPGWAASSSCSGPADTCPPEDLGDWTDFVQTVVTHYNGTTAPKIQYYELWDEADSPKFWFQESSNGMSSYANLAALAAAAYRTIHCEGCSGSLLLMPSVTGGLETATSWLNNYFLADGALFADGASFHGYLAYNSACSPYPFPEDNFSCSGFGDIVTRTTTFQTIFNTNLPGKPIFDSEGSWGKDNITDPDQQVAWLARWYLLQAGTGVLQQATWFTWGLSSLMNTDASNQWGQITTDSLTNGDDVATPTSAGLAYGYLYDWLVGASISPCSQLSNVWTCNVVRPNGYQALAVWYYSADETDTTSYTPGTQFTEYRDLSGMVTPINSPGATVTIGPQPILLESAGLPSRAQFRNPIESKGRVASDRIPALSGTFRKPSEDCTTESRPAPRIR